MAELELPPWLSYVTFDEEGLRTTGIVQLPLTYTGPSIPLEWPWTQNGDANGPMQVSLLGGSGFQTLGPTTITAVRPEPTNGSDNNDDTGEPTTVPGIVTTQPDGEEETVPAASPTAPTVVITQTDAEGDATATATLPGILTTLSRPTTGDSDGTSPVATTVPATESTLADGQTTLVPVDSTLPVITTATLPGNSVTTATGFISTLPDGDTTAVFPTLSSVLDSASTYSGDASATESSATPSSDESASSTTETGSDGGDSSSNDDDDGLSGGQIAGIVVGVIAGVLLLLGLLLLCCLARRRRRQAAAGDGGAYARSHSTDDPGWDRNTNPSRRHASDGSDVEADPRQLFMQPPPDYPIGPDGRRTMRDLSRDDLLARYGQQKGHASPPVAAGGFAQRLLSRPVDHQATLGSYQTVSTSEPSWGSISSSFRGSPMPPPPPPAPSNRTSVTEGAEEHALPALLSNSPPSSSSQPTIHPFSPFSDTQPSLQHTGTSSSPPASSSGGAEPSSGAFKRLSTIHSEPSLRFAEGPEQRPSKKSSDRSKGTSTASKQLGLSGLGLGALFGLVGQGRRAISLSDAEESRGNKQSTTSDPTPVYNVPQAQLHQRHSVSSSSSSSSAADEEYGTPNEEAAFLPAGPSANAGDPFITRWSRTTFGKRIGSSIETASQDTHSMVASILSSNRSLSSSQRRAMAVAGKGKRAVSEGTGSLGRRTQNSSDDSKKSQRSALSRHSPAYWKAQEAGMHHYSSDEKVPITDDDEEDRPSIRLVSRTQEVV